MKKLTAIFLLAFSMIGGLSVFAINTSEDIDKTIFNLYEELQFDQKRADDEIKVLQEMRKGYWDKIVELQKETDKAALVLYAQDGGSLFCVGMASEALSNVCNSFNTEKAPFENWLKAMTALSSRYTYIKTALQKMHTENLTPNTIEYINNSISICDSLDARFASVRDSIVFDQQKYEKLAAEIQGFEIINRKVIDQIRAQIFQNNNEGFISLFSAFNYMDMDFFYDEKSDFLMAQTGSDSVIESIDRWSKVQGIIALLLSLSLLLILRFVLPQSSPYRSKRWCYALLLYIALSIIGMYVMSWTIGLNSFMRHMLDVCTDSYFFMFWMVLAATIRLKRPGIGWSILAYALLFFLDFFLIAFATNLTRSQSLKVSMSIMGLFATIVVLLILAFGAKRFLKADYLAIFSCFGLVLLSTVLVFMGYYYPSFILVLFCVSVMTYAAAFVCLKHFFAKRIERGGPILRLTLSHLIYPVFFIFAIMESLYEAANVFNLRTWLDTQMATPFFDYPQYAVISASRIIWLIFIGIIVNYVIKLIKLMLIRIDKNKYETGGNAVAMTLGTMLAWFAFGILALIVLQINHGGVIAAVGGASLGIGFALKETLENLISGLQLMASRARPGDLIKCDGVRGVIKRIGILSTQIEVEDGPIASFPNRQLLCSMFTNLTLNHRREIRHIVFDIAADSDLELAKKLMKEASRPIEGVVDHDKHSVVMRNTNSGIVRLDYKCWIDSALYLSVEPAVREAIFKAFRANGIKIADFTSEISSQVTTILATNNCDSPA